MGHGAGGARTASNAKGGSGPETGRQVAARGEPGNRVRFSRAELGINQAKLVEDLGVSFQTLGYLEREEYRPSSGFAWEVSEHFGLPTEAVFADEPMPLVGRMLYGKGGS